MNEQRVVQLDGHRPAKRRWPYSAVSLCLGGVVLIGLGVYFLFMRPPLLPEDLRFLGASSVQVKETMPVLPVWLAHVFQVMGGFMLTVGLLTCHLAAAAFRRREPGALHIAAITGMASIGWMSIVNFLIDSDFKWLLLAFTAPWIAAVLLYLNEGRR